MSVLKAENLTKKVTSPEGMLTIVDDVAREIGAPDRKAVARATSELCTMHAAQFSRYHGRCTTCGTPATVIAANRLVWA